MKQEFKAGATVYSENGQAAEYVARIESGHIVRPIVEGYDGDESYDYVSNPATWHAVFVEPPVAKFNDELKAIHEKIAAARQCLSEVREEERRANASNRERLDRLAKIDQLRYIEDFLDGKLTHYAVIPDYNGAPSVMVAAEAFHDKDDERRAKPRLFCLYGDRKDRTLEWHLHHYSDSSGTMYGGSYYPARSQEEAEEIIRTKLREKVRLSDGSDYHTASLVANATKWGIEVPEKLAVEAARVEAERHAASVLTAQRDYERAAARMVELGITLVDAK